MNIALTVIITLMISSTALGSSIKNEIDSIQKRNKEEFSKVRVSKRGNQPREHFIDPYKKNRQEKRAQYYDSCRKNKFEKMILREKCYKNANKKFNEEYPNRGTDDYSEKFYSKLSKGQAIKKRNELIGLMDIISFHPKPENKGVELVIDDLASEIMYIEIYVLKVNPRDYKPYK